MAAINGGTLEHTLEGGGNVSSDDAVGQWVGGPKPAEIRQPHGDTDDRPVTVPQAKEPRVSFLRLYSLADPYDYVFMFFGTIAAVVHGVMFPVMLLYFGRLLDVIGERQGNLMRKVDEYALDFEWLGLVCLCSSWLEVSLWMQTGERQTAKLRVKYLQALLRQDISYFDTRTSTGDVVNSIALDPLAVQDAISENMGSSIQHITLFIASIVIGVHNQWRIAILTIAVLPPVALVASIYVYYVTVITSEATSAYAEAGSIAEQAVSQVRTVYSFVIETTFVKSYSNALQKNTRLGIKGGLAKGLGLGTTSLTFNVCVAVLVFFGGVVIRQGRTTGAGALSTILMVVTGSLAIGPAVSNLTAFAKARVVAFKIFQLIEQEATINKPDQHADTLKTVAGHIELRNVDFSYPSRPDAPIFKNFSLVIPSGQTVAIVGSSGSGKSTIVSLIERFYDPSAGEVLLDGHDLKMLDLKWLRRQIGLVNQEPSLFATTIAANILYGLDHDASQEDIEETAKLANIHSFISELSHGYQTQVGEGGLQLSGGQKQRIAIARAVLRNPRVLLLDEATSALDAGSEQLVQAALDRIMVGRTTVVVAHRLSTIRNVDTIAVLQQGHIVERGSHQDLISREDGAYAALVRLQELTSSNDSVVPDLPTVASPYSGLRSSIGPPHFRVTPSHSSPGIHPVPSDDALKKGDSEAQTVNQLLEETQGKASKGKFVRLLAMTKEDWPHTILGILGSIATGVVNPVIAVILGELLSSYYQTDFQSMKSGVLRCSLAFVALGVLAPFILVLQHYPLAIVGERLVKRVRERMLSAILRNELGWFDEDDNKSSQVAGRLASDAANVRVAIAEAISVLLQNLALVVVVIVLSMFLEWKIALVMIGTIPLGAISFVAESWILGGLARDRGKAYDRATQIAGEAVANIRTMAAFSAENKVQTLYKAELEVPAKRSFLKGNVAGLGFGFAKYLTFSICALVLWYSGLLVERNEATFSVCTKTFMILIVCSHAIGETLATSPALARAGQGVASVFQVLDRETRIEPDDGDGKRIVDKLSGHIELRDVTLAYPSRPDIVVLRNLNLKVAAGRSLALVGASGSGKSSIISLIERFYDPVAGQILIDGVEIKTYNLQSLRQHIALVQQEPALFATTIYENILHGKDGASESEVIEAAKAADAHRFISSLPDGYNTQVGGRGVQLSGGQKQRVAIARAVLKDPAILLLDEATSALDAESEKVVQEALDRLMTGTTTVIVAHRLNTVRGADSIALLHDGYIAEEGSHSVLVTLGGRYAHLIDLQNRAPHQASSINPDASCPCDGLGLNSIQFNSRVSD